MTKLADLPNFKAVEKITTPAKTKRDYSYVPCTNLRKLATRFGAAGAARAIGMTGAAVHSALSSGSARQVVELAAEAIIRRSQAAGSRMTTMVLTLTPDQKEKLSEYFTSQGIPFTTHSLD